MDRISSSPPSDHFDDDWRTLEDTSPLLLKRISKREKREEVEQKTAYGHNSFNHTFISSDLTKDVPTRTDRSN